MQIDSQGLTLDQAIRTALEADPVIQAAREAFTQAQADLVTVSLPPNPQLSSSQTLLPLDRPFTVRRQGGPPQFDVELSYPIDWFVFGKRAAAMASARLAIDVAAAEVAEVIRQRIAGTIAAFYDVLEAQALLDLARENLDDLKRVETITADRVALGGAGTIELDRIRLAVFDSQREARNRETALAVATAQLRAFLGLTDAPPTFAVRGSLDVPTPATPLSVENVLALAEQHRPDVLALRLQLAKAETDLRVEQKRAYPQVIQTVGYTRQFQEKAIGFPDVNAWGVGIDVSLPLFDRNQGNRAKAQSVQRQTHLNLRAKLVDLRAEVEQAVKEYQAAYVTVTTDDPARLTVAENVRDKIRAAYALGGKSLLEVLDAQRAYRDTYQLYLTSRAHYWRALHRLNAAIGRQVLR
ncbi:MAG: TolC family protein [Candidatus Binatia bacterium]|nr:TolC family protein [Candidatus Binatia bacterium]